MTGIDPTRDAVVIRFGMTRKCPPFKIEIQWFQPLPTPWQRMVNRVGEMLSVFTAGMHARGPMWFVQPPLVYVNPFPKMRYYAHTVPRTGKYDWAAAQIRDAEDVKFFAEVDRIAEKMRSQDA